MRGYLFGEEGVGESVEGDVVDFVYGVAASGVVITDGAAEEFGGLENEFDVSVLAGLYQFWWGRICVGPEEFSFGGVDGVEWVLELAVEGFDAVLVVADGGGVVDVGDEDGVEAFGGFVVVVLEGVAGDEASEDASLDSTFGLEAGC